MYEHFLISILLKWRFKLVPVDLCVKALTLFDPTVEHFYGCCKIALFRIYFDELCICFRGLSRNIYINKMKYYMFLQSIL